MIVNIIVSNLTGEIVQRDHTLAQENGKNGKMVMTLGSTLTCGEELVCYQLFTIFAILVV